MLDIIIKGIFGSKGAKRLLASLIGVLMTVVTFVPEAQVLVDILQNIAGTVGGVGVVHAAGAGTLTKAKMAGLASLCSTLLALTYVIPALVPAASTLTKLVSLFSALAVGQALGKQSGISETLKSLGISKV